MAWVGHSLTLTCNLYPSLLTSCAWERTAWRSAIIWPLWHNLSCLLMSRTHEPNEDQGDRQWTGLSGEKKKQAFCRLPGSLPTISINIKIESSYTLLSFRYGLCLHQKTNKREFYTDDIMPSCLALANLGTLNVVWGQQDGLVPPFSTCGSPPLSGDCVSEILQVRCLCYDSK